MVCRLPSTRIQKRFDSDPSWPAIRWLLSLRKRFKNFFFRSMTASEERPDKDPVSQEQNASEPQESAPQADFAAELASLVQENENLKARLAQEEDRVLRTAAEFDNFRKRAARERDDARRTGAASVIEDLLPVLDNLGYGLEAAAKIPEAKPVLEGVNYILVQLQNALSQNGLREINPVGETFDARLHESVGREAHPTVAEDKVIAVRRKGYLLNEKLLRPAAVVISAGTETPSAS